MIFEEFQNKLQITIRQRVDKGYLGGSQNYGPFFGSLS